MGFRPFGIRLLGRRDEPTNPTLAEARRGAARRTSQEAYLAMLRGEGTVAEYAEAMRAEARAGLGWPLTNENENEERK